MVCAAPLWNLASCVATIWRVGLQFAMRDGHASDVCSCLAGELLCRPVLASMCSSIVFAIVVGRSCLARCDRSSSHSGIVNQYRSVGVCDAGTFDERWAPSAIPVAMAELGLLHYVRQAGVEDSACTRDASGSGIEKLSRASTRVHAPVRDCTDGDSARRCARSRLILLSALAGLCG